MTARSGPQVLTLPAAPVLLTRVGGRLDPAAELRRLCLTAITPLVSAARRVIVVATAATVTGRDPDRSYEPDQPSDLGRLIGRDRSPGPAGSPLPTGLAVGRQLLRTAGWRGPLLLQAVDPATTPQGCRTVAADLRARDDDLLVAVGDGSALRRPGGPGPVHPQAAGYDAAVLDAWRSGDRDALLGLDADLAAELLVTGRVPWQVAAAAAGGDIGRAAIHYAGDPNGVFHLIACWR